MNFKPADGGARHLVPALIVLLLTMALLIAGCPAPTESTEGPPQYRLRPNIAAATRSFSLGAGLGVCVLLVGWGGLVLWGADSAFCADTFNRFAS
jgi:hypothetical protein